MFSIGYDSVIFSVVHRNHKIPFETIFENYKPNNQFPANFGSLKAEKSL
jgi:hypothetical protein